LGSKRCLAVHGSFGDKPRIMHQQDQLASAFSAILLDFWLARQGYELANRRNAPWAYRQSI
jgi:hypothetical protein